MKYSKCFKKHSRLYFGRINGEYIVTDGIVILPLYNNSLKCTIWKDGCTIEDSLFIIDNLDSTLLDNAVCAEIRSKDTNLLTGEKLSDKEIDNYIIITYKNDSKSELLSIREVTGYEYLEDICNPWNYGDKEKIEFNVSLVSSIVELKKLNNLVKLFKIKDFRISDITSYKSSSVDSICYKICQDNFNIYFTGL